MLTKTAQSAEDMVRVCSTQALAAIGKDASNAIPVLVRLSKDKNEGVRISAVDALGRVSEAVAALKLALSDESSDVQSTARQALGIIPRGGK
jgi:HEAT repeat protein